MGSSVSKINFNLHRPFRADNDGFINQIKPTQDQRNMLDQCRAAVHQHLRESIKLFCQMTFGEPVTAKFRVQGSWAYGTCNQPANLVTQEMDLDYGVYLPAYVFSDQRSDHSAKAYFAFVEISLQVLAKQKGWTIDPKNQKPTCVRIDLPSKPGEAKAHLDVPMYVVPDRMFAVLKENTVMALDSLTKNESIAAQSRSVFSKEAYNLKEEAVIIDLDAITTIHLALRDGGWKDSDCEMVRKWFSEQQKKQTEDGGRQLRYVTRYLKAWRDQTWGEGGPTSILLMVITAKHYKFMQGQDDLALLNVAEKLADSLMGEVKEPAIKGHENEDFNGPKRSEDAAAFHSRKSANANQARRLYRGLVDALGSDRKHLALAELRTVFGDRMTTNVDLVTPVANATSHDPSHVEQMRQAVLTTPATVQTNRPVPSQKGG